MRQFDAAYFAASVDTPETNMKFAKSLDLDYPILSDPSREVARAYGVLGSTGFARRWTFFIDVHGRIAAIDKNVNPGSHGEAIVQRLASLKSDA